MATTDKYDRQLRLWGAQGQRALGETKVVAVGASAAGTETLKNLILPGIGAFCVVDFVSDKTVGSSSSSSSQSQSSSQSASPTQSQSVTDQDAASNFFLPQHDQDDFLGLSKAEVACKNLKELNPDVRGSHRNISLSSEEHGGPGSSDYWKRVLEEESELKLETDAETQTQTTNKVLVVASDLVPAMLEALAEACYGSGYPLVVVASYGLIGCVRLQLPKEGHPILQPKPTNASPDLRLVTSFPAFREYVESLAGGDAMDKMDSQQHGHVPYPVLLAKAMEQYRKANAKEGEGEDTKLLPKTYAEKQDFVQNFVKPMSRDTNKELNFQEAIANAYLAYTERDLNWLHEPAPKKGSKLGQLRTALETFMKEHPDHRPPLNGSVPDMTASTNLYVRLQQLYKDQAKQDLEQMTEILRKQPREDSDGDSATGSYDVVTDEDIANFCANVYAVGHLHTRSLRDEYHNSEAETIDEELIDDWKMALMDPYEVPVHTPLLWYLGVRACQVFCHNEGRYPGCVAACGDDKDALERDAVGLSKILRSTILPHYKLSDEGNGDDNSNNELLSEANTHNICRELTRYGNAEVHTVASVVGGVASQEAVKLITGQYVPLNNTYVYNGIVSVGGVYRF